MAPAADAFIDLVGLALLNDDVRAVAKWALIPAFISALLTLFIRETRAKQPKVKRTDRVKRAPLPKHLKRAITTLVLIQLTNIPDALLLLRLHDIGFSSKGVHNLLQMRRVLRCKQLVVKFYLPMHLRDMRQEQLRHSSKYMQQRLLCY